MQMCRRKNRNVRKSENLWENGSRRKNTIFSVKFHCLSILALWFLNSLIVWLSPFSPSPYIQPYLLFPSDITQVRLFQDFNKHIRDIFKPLTKTIKGYHSSHDSKYAAMLSHYSGGRYAHVLSASHIYLIYLFKISAISVCTFNSFNFYEQLHLYALDRLHKILRFESHFFFAELLALINHISLIQQAKKLIKKKVIHKLKVG